MNFEVSHPWLEKNKAYRTLVPLLWKVPVRNNTMIVRCAKKEFRSTHLASIMSARQCYTGSAAAPIEVIGVRGFLGLCGGASQGIRETSAHCLCILRHAKPVVMLPL
eukprot:GHVU01027553.1.p2 GENE.GHVU01027553.1~~GHVU01027553.1.p2  ORF type:complete len:107 (-),score=0.27 GHVU01027553.1:483-803(-)